MHQRYTHTETHTHTHPRTSDALFGRDCTHTYTHSQKEQMRREAGLTAWWAEEWEGKWFIGGERGEPDGRRGRRQGDETEGMAEGKAAEWEAKCLEHIQLWSNWILGYAVDPWLDRSGNSLFASQGCSAPVGSLRWPLAAAAHSSQQIPSPQLSQPSGQHYSSPTPAVPTCSPEPGTLGWIEATSAWMLATTMAILGIMALNIKRERMKMARVKSSLRIYTISYKLEPMGHGGSLCMGPIFSRLYRGRP